MKNREWVINIRESENFQLNLNFVKNGKNARFLENLLEQMGKDNLGNPRFYEKPKKMTYVMGKKKCRH